MTKEIIKETKYFKAYYISKHQLQIVEWLPATKNMEDEEYLEQVDIITELVKEYKPKLGISEMTNFFFTIAPDIQEEVDKKNASAFAEAGLEKLALVINRVQSTNHKDKRFEADFEKMSLEQVAKEENHSKLNTQIFNTVEEVYKWFFN